MQRFISESRWQWLCGVPLKPHEAAAILIQLAADGERALPKPYECTRERDCYYLHRKYQPEIRLAAWSILLLQFFERPRWSYHRDHWNDSDYFPQAGLPHVSDNILLPLYLLLLAVIGWGVVLEAGYEMFGMVGGDNDTSSNYKFMSIPIKKNMGRKTPRTLFFLTLIVLLVALTQVITALFCRVGGIADRPFWVAPSMTLFIILAERSTSRRYSYMLRTLPTFLGLLFVLGLTIALFTTMGFLIFSTSSEEKDLYFDNFGDGMWNMFMILIGSNWPLPIMPSIQCNRGYFMFFLVFLCFSDWGFLNLIIGYIFSTMTTQRDRGERLSILDFKLNMAAAFSILDPESNQAISINTLDLVLREISMRYNNWGRIFIFSAVYSFFKHLFKRSKPDMPMHEQDMTGAEAAAITNDRYRVNRFSSTALRESLVMVDAVADDELKLLLYNLFSPVQFDPSTGKPIVPSIADVDNFWCNREEDSATNCIKIDLFYQFPSRCFGEDAMRLMKHYRLRLIKETDARNISPDSICHYSAFRRYLKFGDTKYFDASIDFLLAFLSVLILAFGFGLVILYIMIVVMFIEDIIRFVSKGKKRFLDSFRNIVDAKITMLFVILVVVTGINGHEVNTSDWVVRGLMLLRLCFIVRNVTLFDYFDQKRKKFRIALKYCAQGAEDVIYLLLVTFCFAVAYCEFGVLVFGGAIQRHGSNGRDISNSLYGEGDYWPLNFNDFASGLGTLFTALHINNVHVTSSGFESIMPVYQPRLFFTAWHAVSVMLLLNVIPAFLLNNFWQYYIAARSEIQQNSQNENSKGNLSVSTEANPSPFPDDEISDMQSFSSTLNSIAATEFSVEMAPVVYDERHGEVVMISSRPTPNQFLEVKLCRQSHDMALDTIRPRVLTEWTAAVWKGPNVRDTDVSTKPVIEIEDKVDCTSSDAPSETAGTTGTSSLKNGGWGFFSFGNQSTMQQSFLNESEEISSGHQTLRSGFSIPFLSWILRYLAIGDGIVDRSVLAAILVQHAKDGIMPVLFSSPFASYCYLKRMKNSLLFRFVARVLMVLCCFMRPSWTYVSSFSEWKDNEKYPKTSAFLDVRVGAALCIFLLLLLLYGVGLEFIYNLEAEVVTESTQLAQCLAAIEGVVVDSAIPLPLTDENAESVAPSASMGSSQFKWFRIFTPSINRKTSASNGTGGTGFSTTATEKDTQYLPDLRGPLINEPAVEIAVDAAHTSKPLNRSLESIILFCWDYFSRVLFSHWTWRVILCLLIIEEISLSIYSAATSTYNNPFFVSLLSVLWFDRYAFRKFRTMMSILGRFTTFLGFFAVLTIVLAVFASEMYYDADYKDGNDAYFSSFEDSLWNIFLIITSTSFPNQILPSYRDDRVSITFFVVVVAVGAFLFLNLILLVVNSEFETGKNRLEAVEKNFRSLNLQLAFEILDIEDKGYLGYGEIEKVLEVLYVNFADFKKRGVPSEKMRRILVSCMDVNSNRKITTREFSMILDVTRIKLSLENDRNYLFETYFPGWTKSEDFKRVSSVATHRHFSLAIDICVLVCMCIEFTSDGNVYSFDRATSASSLGVLCIIILAEMLLNIILMGKSYFSSFDRKLECLLASTCSVAYFFTFFTSTIGLSDGVIVIRILGLIRLCLALRNVDLYAPSLKFKNLAVIFLRVCKNLGSLSVSFLVTMLVFSVIGIYMFGGLINRDPDRDEFARIKLSRYGENEYWPLNFNDVPSGLMTLICILHVSDWDVITEGFVEAVDNKYPRVFFTLWYCIGVLLLLNIVKSFFMRGFFVNYEVFLSTTADKRVEPELPIEEAPLDDSDSESIGSTRPRRDTHVYIHGSSLNTIESSNTELFSASVGALKFLSPEDRSFLQHRITSVLKEGTKFKEF